MFHFISSVRAACVSASIVLVGGCGIFPDAVRINDHNAPVAAVRVTVRPEALARNAESLRGFQIGYERYRAKGTQELLTGQSVQLTTGGPSVPGPDTLRSEVLVEQTHLVYTHTFLFGPNIELEPMLGAAHFRFDARVEPAASPERLSLHFSRTQFYGGITPRWRFNDAVALELRAAACVGPFTIDGNNIDLGLSLRPEKSVALWLGYSWRNSGGRLDAQSEIRTRARGPSAALLFDF
jgi:hypothetical protein